MDTLLSSIQSKQNVIVTSLQGFERSRFLLRSELISLVKRPTQTKDQQTFSKIVHVCDKEQTLKRLHYETTQMPFEQFGFKVAKYYNLNDESDSLDSQHQAQLILCTLKHLINVEDTLTTTNALVVFDVSTLESIESTCCEVQELKYPKNEPNIFLPQLEFGQLASKCWSIVLACNAPTDGLEAELGCKFPIVLSDPQLSRPDYKVRASIQSQGPERVPFNFRVREKGSRIHEEVGAVLEDVVKQVGSGGILVFFPSYGRMIEFHSVWRHAGLWERIGVPYDRENRAGDQFKQGLISLAGHKKSIFLSSIRYHQDETLAEFVFSMVSAVVVVGLPYPFTNHLWDARIEYNSTQANSLNDTGRLSGDQLFKYRAIEFMNGVLKRCLNEFRYSNCDFHLLDEALGSERSKLTKELGK